MHQIASSLHVELGVDEVQALALSLSKHIEEMNHKISRGIEELNSKTLRTTMNGTQLPENDAMR
jgi:hypothetical protein